MAALWVENLTKNYPNKVAALKGINLIVDHGDFFALLGKNGAGKSTFIGILCSLVKKTSGKVEILGHDLDTELEIAKSCIGVVPQEFNFNPFEKIFQIVMNQGGYYGISRKIAAERAEFYLKKLSLWNKRNQIALRLSGGMKRRLMIARALINQPPLLILDEPTAGVDVELRHSLWKFLTELNQSGTTIILTTHYLEEAEQLCRNVAIIDQGNLIEHTQMKALLNRAHVQTIIFDLIKPLLFLPDLKNFTARLIDPNSLEIEIKQQQNLSDLFDLFNQYKISVSSMRNKTNRLEELFVRLTREGK